MAYGFLDIKFDKMLASMKHETGTFYLFIPQVKVHSLRIRLMDSTILDYLVHFIKEFQFRICL